MRFSFLAILFLVFKAGYSQFAPPANQTGTTAIHKDSSAIVSWASSVVEFQRGPQDISAGAPLADFGDSTNALGVAEGNSTDVVSLGDGGVIVLTFQYPIENGPGPDFAIFENSFSHDYLELAHVEVSTDGINFVRIPSESAIQTDTQTDGFGSTNASEIHNLAGKYIQGYGTPFDLQDIVDSAGVNLDSIHYVRIIDVVGSINSAYGSTDAYGTLINDPYPTAFGSGGFDLDAVAVINENNIFASANQEQVNFTIYPNPTNGQIKLKVEGNKVIQLIDITGKIIAVWEENPGAINLVELGLEKGIYLIRIGETSKRVILR
ncbi:MAG: T9SS type A sorting domain-containing protein [Crocinitomicaceae bacterium]|nr:T9SS type A sorting domain-containing protein [Crocinitomicaceae bacterium]